MAAQLMGFGISDIRYLWHCYRKGLGADEIGQMEILGEESKDFHHRFPSTPTYEAQKGWALVDKNWTE